MKFNFNRYIPKKPTATRYVLFDYTVNYLRKDLLLIE